MKRSLVSMLVIIALGAAPPGDGSRQGLVDLLFEYLEVRYPDTAFSGEVLYVSVQRQRLFHVRDRELAGEYVVSTSAKGMGNAMGSEQTPEGLHRIGERIGEGVPPGGVFQERVFTGRHASAPSGEEDVVTSRILVLEGLEPGHNLGGTVDSGDRHIYIHGTPDVEGLGKPLSHGCIRMSDADVILLFDAVQAGTPVVILDN